MPPLGCSLRLLYEAPVSSRGNSHRLPRRSVARDLVPHFFAALTCLSVATAAACGAPQTGPAPPRTHLDPATGWGFATWFSLASGADLEVVAVRPTSSGFDVVFDDNSHYAGDIPGLAVASSRDDRVHFDFPFLGLCLRGEVASTSPWLLSCPLFTPWAATLDDGGHLVKSDATPAPSRAPVIGHDRCPTLRGAHLNRAHVASVELDGSPAVLATILGRGLDDYSLDGPSSLRLVTCTPSTGEERVVELSAAASSAALAVGSDGRPVVAFVEHRDARVRLVVARPGAESPKTADARVPDALDACASLHVVYGPISEEDRKSVGSRLSPEERRCSMVLADATARLEAFAILDARCTQGDARACTLAGSFVSHFLVRLSFGFAKTAEDLSTKKEARWLPHDPDRPDDKRAARLFERGCTLGDSDACTRVLDALDPPEAAKSDLARSECTKGNAFACGLKKAYGVP